MSFCDNNRPSDSFRFVCDTAIERLGPQLAKFVFKEALAEFDLAQKDRIELDVLWTGRTWVDARGAYDRAVGEAA